MALSTVAIAAKLKSCCKIQAKIRLNYAQEIVSHSSSSYRVTLAHWQKYLRLTRQRAVIMDLDLLGCQQFGAERHTTSRMFCVRRWYGSENNKKGACIWLLRLLTQCIIFTQARQHSSLMSHSQIIDLMRVIRSRPM